MRISVSNQIARQVWRSLFRTQSTLVLMALVALMIGYAAYSGIGLYNSQQRIRNNYEKEVRSRWENRPDKHPHRMAHYGYLVFRPKHPMSFFDFGLESYTGNAIFLEAHKQNTANFSEASFSTGLLRFGEISVAMILQLLIPLFIIFLGFNVVSSEREANTLKLLLSQGASWREIIAGKSMGLFLVATVLFLPATLLALGSGMVQESAQSGTHNLLRALLLLGAYGIYFAVVCVGTVAVSTLSRSSKTALATLIGLWLMLGIVLPRATQALGNSLYPSPSKIEFETTIEKDLIQKGDSHNPDDPHYKALKDSVLAANRVESVDQLPFNYSGFQMKEGERISAELYNQHLGRLLAIYQKQNSVARFTAFFNPYTAIRNVSMVLCGTDFATYMDFQQQAEAYRYRLAQHMNELQIKLISSQKQGEYDKPYTISKTNWSAFPDFDYRPAPLTEAFGSEPISFLALLFWVVLVGVGIRYLSKKASVI